MRNLIQFVSAVARNWLQLASGGLFAVIGWLWPSITTKLGHPQWANIVPEAFIWGLAVVGLFVALFKAWLSEYLAKENALTKIKEISEPQFEASIDQLAFGSIMVDNPPTPAFLCIAFVSITNLGAPSIADQFSGAVVFPNGRKHPLAPYILRGDAKIGASTLRFSDSIVIKAVSAPIQRNARIRGQVFFKPDLPGHDVDVIGNAIEVSFADAKGRRTMMSRKIEGGGSPELRYVPGAFDL